MISRWKDFLRENSSRWRLPIGGEWSFLMLNVTHPVGCNIDLLWFHDGDIYPRAVAKLSTHESFFRAEFQNLLDVYACAPEWTPRPLDLVHKWDFWALWIEGVPGSAFLEQSTRVALEPVVEMLGDMHKAIRDRGNWPYEDRYRRSVLEPIESLERLSTEGVMIAGCAELRATISAEWICSLPIIPQHCDFFPGNLLQHKNQFRVVDWEYFGRVDLPLFDLLTLLLATLRRGGDRPEDWDSSLVEAIPRLIDSYARKIGLSPEDVASLIPLTLVNWFHLQRHTKHASLSSQAYHTLRHFFEHRELWEGVFVRRGLMH